MRTTRTHIPLTELAHDPVDVFRCMTSDEMTVEVENATGKKMVLRPLVTGTTPRTERKKMVVDYAALTAAAGSWHDIDSNAFLRQVDKSRTLSTRLLAAF